MSMLLLTKRQVAEMLGLHRESIMRLVRNGQFPKPIRMQDAPNAHVRFDSDEIEAWLVERKASRG